jgi:superoxide reductase
MREVLKCNLCGKMIMILEDGGRRTICCDQLMEKLVEQGGKPGKDRHVPVIEKAKDGITVHAGGMDTPMGEDY